MKSVNIVFYAIFLLLSQNIFSQSNFIPNPEDAEILIVVNMNDAKDKNGISFSSIENVVFAFHSSNPIFTSSDSSWQDSLGGLSSFMSDNGTNGDKIAYDGFWSIIIYFPIYSPRISKYKYSANYNLNSNGGSNDNESTDSLYHYLILLDINHGYETIYGEIHNVFGVLDTQDVVISVEQSDSEFPTIYKLEQNYPNPFNPSTTIAYSIPNDGSRETSNVKLIVYDVLGNEIATLVNEQQRAGFYEVKFDAKNLTSGIYIYRLQSGNISQSKKMILVK